ncbi:hypothetical protein C8R45DRAFT_930439 [Mycena sanguinolenta]|nr:hypothetical protein C8R45DRAFT_930439 [Mycena sanguinolenta]
MKRISTSLSFTIFQNLDELSNSTEPPPPPLRPTSLFKKSHILNRACSERIQICGGAKKSMMQGHFHMMKLPLTWVYKQSCVTLFIKAKHRTHCDSFSKKSKGTSGGDNREAYGRCPLVSSARTKEEEAAAEVEVETEA